MKEEFIYITEGKYFPSFSAISQKCNKTQKITVFAKARGKNKRVGTYTFEEFIQKFG